MNNTIQYLVLTVCLVGLPLTGCQTSPNTASSTVSHVPATSEQDAASDAPAADEDILLTVYGMSCPLCATNVDKQLLKVPGVEDVKVNLSTGVIRVRASKDQPPSSEQLAKAVRESGFTLVGEPTAE